MKKQTDFRISQVKTFILLPNSKTAATKRMLAGAKGNGAMQYPDLLSHCKSPGTKKLGQAALAEPYTRQCGSQGTHCEPAMLFPSAENTTQLKPDQGGVCAQRQHSVGTPQESSFPDKCLLLSFPNLRRANSHTSTLSTFLFYRSLGTRAAWQQKDEIEAA